MQHHPHHHGSTGPTIAADPHDGAFAALIAVPAVVFAAIWAAQTPTVAVGVVAFAVGVKTAGSDVPARVADAIRAATRRKATETDEPPDPAGTAVR